MKKIIKTRGFTLTELLIIIGILTALFVIALIAVNPSRQFKQANNTQRRSDVNAILNAVTQYAADNNGALPDNIDGDDTNIGSDTEDADICDDLVDTYIAEMPVDPTEGSWIDCSSYNTGYTISISKSSGRVTVVAPSAELNKVIDVTR